MDRPKDDALDESSVRQQQDGVKGIPGSLRVEEDSTEDDKMDGKCRKVPRKRCSKPEDGALIGSMDNAERTRELEDGNKLTEKCPIIPEERESKPKDEELIGKLGRQQLKADRTRKTEDSSEDSKLSGIYPKIPETLGIKPENEQSAEGEALIATVGKHDKDPHKTGATEGDPKSEKHPKLPGKRKRKPKDESLVGPPRKQQHNLESPRKTEGPSKSKTNPRKSGNPRNRGLAKLTRRVKTFGGTVKKLWDVWSTFKTRNNQDPNPTVPDKTLGIPGFEEIACIEAEVPDIMMMDKDRVRTSCKECMQDPPAFPSKEQVKAKLIAADKYYGVRDTKSKAHSDTLEHEADYYDDVDGTVVRPSWRFILERPLVEQYVLMTNYIRKVSVISELKEEKESTKFVEEEDSDSDTEYKKFEQKFISGRRELLKPILKPKTQEMAVQTSFIPEPTVEKEELGESVSEISLYPGSEESTNSPEASAVTIVTSRDYSSPLQSDFDGRTTDKSASYKDGNWWECQASCEPSESFQTSRDSVNKNVSSGSDGQSIPVHAAWGETCLRPKQMEPSNEGKWIVPSSQQLGEESTMPKLKDPKKVRFSPVVTYYRGPEKNAAVYKIPEDLDNVMGAQQVEPQQNTQAETPTNELATEEPGIVEELKTPEAKPKPPMTLTNILQERKSDQIVSVTLPKGWHEDRILHNKEKVSSIAVSRATTGNRPVTKKISFQSYDEIPDVQFSNPQISPVRETTDANIETQTQVTQQSTLAARSKAATTSRNTRETTDANIETQTQVTQQSMFAARSKAATTSRNTKPKPMQSVYTNVQFQQTRKPDRNPADNSRITHENLDVTSRRNDHQVMESVGTGTNIQAVANRQVIPRQKSGTSSKADTLRGPAKPPLTPSRLQCPSNPPTQHHFPSTPLSSWEYRKEIPQENVTDYQPMQHGTYSNAELRNEPQDTRPRTLSDPSVSDRLLPKPYVLEASQKQQQVSTDTEGSSTSNDHIKLKASPACFFKVATPTDLSKISVDDFYPDVPEIDAELSQNSETITSSPPKVELVFENADTALKCVPDTYFKNHRITGKEENAILQSCAVPSRTIMVSPGIEIRGLMDIPQQAPSSGAVASKAPAMAAIQSSCKIAKPPKKESSIVPEKASRTGNVLKHEAMLEGVKQILNSKQDRKSETLRLKDARSLSLDPQKQEPKTLKQQQILATIRGGPNKDRLEESSGGEDVMGKAQKSHRQSVSSGGKETYDDQKIQKEIKQDEKKSESESDSLQRQCDNIVNDQGNPPPLGRAKNFMKTLSSLVEETSSVVESTSSSTAEKVMDMPDAATARSVEELKTIFEKKPEASGSGVSEIEENQRQSNKCIPERKFPTAGSIRILEKMIDVEDIAGSSGSKEIFNTKTQGQCSSLPKGQNLSSEEEKLQTLNVTKTHATKGTADSDKRTQPDGSNDANKNPAELHGESSTQQLSQIDVIRPSEIYSNTSMYFSTSEDRAAKFTKPRTAFEPMTLDDEDASRTSGKNVKCLQKLPGGSIESHPISTKSLKFKDPKQEQERNSETIGGDSSLDGDKNLQTIVDKNNKFIKEQKGTEEYSVNDDQHSQDVHERNGNNEIPTTHEAADKIQKADPQTEDTSKPTETKQWLMDVIPRFSKHTRFHGFRPQKPVCMREGADAEGVRSRQEAVKPVFKFLKRQREMEDNK